MVDENVYIMLRDQILEKIMLNIEKEASSEIATVNLDAK